MIVQGFSHLILDYCREYVVNVAEPVATEMQFVSELEKSRSNLIIHRTFYYSEDCFAIKVNIAIHDSHQKY